MNVKFYKPYLTGKELLYIKQLLNSKGALSGDGAYTKQVHALLEKRYGVPKVLLTTSGSTALELAVRLLNIAPGDEVILPSYTFSSTANAVLLRQGIKPVFADICPDTINIDPNSIAKKITKKTRAIIVVHYAGVACDMDTIMALAKRHHLQVIEDAAQALESTYKGKQLGTIGDFGCFSFHDTKNITCGEGGALFINSANKQTWEKAEIIREKGTNRSSFFRGEVDKYTWQDVGSSLLPSDILAAFLLAQLEEATEITSLRKKKYDVYLKKLSRIKTSLFYLPTVPKESQHNAHIFYLVCKTPAIRDSLQHYLKDKGISATFHYQALHSAPVGLRLGNHPADLPVTNQISNCLLRLPLYADITPAEQDYVVRMIRQAVRSLSPARARQSATHQPKALVSVSIGVTVPEQDADITPLVEELMSQKQSGWELKEVIVLTDAPTRKITANIHEVAGSYTKIVPYDQKPAVSHQLNDLAHKFRGDILLIVPAHIRFEGKQILTKLIHPFTTDPSIMLTDSAPTRPTAKTVFPPGNRMAEEISVHMKQLLHPSHRSRYTPNNVLALRRAFAKTITFPTGEPYYQYLEKTQAERGYGAQNVKTNGIQTVAASKNSAPPTPPSLLRKALSHSSGLFKGVWAILIALSINVL